MAPYYLEFTIAVYHSLQTYFERDVKKLVTTCFGDILEWNVLIPEQSPTNKPNFRESTLKIYCKTLLDTSPAALHFIYRTQICKWMKKIQLYSPPNQRLWLGIQKNDAFLRVPEVCHEGLAIAEFALGTLTSCTSFYQQTSLSSYPPTVIVANFYHDIKFIEILFDKTYLVSINYANIRQIIVHEDEFSTHLFFHLLCPTMHYSVHHSKPSLGKTYGKTFKYRTLVIAGVTPDQVGRSNVVKLSLPKSLTTQEVISRMYFRCGKVPIIYTYIQVYYAPESENFPNINLVNFECTFMFNAILRRSFLIQMQNPESKFDDLVEYLTQLALQNPHLLYLTLVDLMHLIDDIPFFDFKSAVEMLFDWYEKNEDSLNKDSYYIQPPKTRNVWRITLTPTRQLLWPAEIMYENRILRSFDSEYACRVSFRDDTNTKLSLNSSKSEDCIFESAISTPMIKGLMIGSRHFEFLGWSNSQIRDHGVWLYAKDKRGNTAEVIRRWMGDFSSIRNVPMFMARMGQCFSKSEEAVKIPLNSQNVVTESDVVGGWNLEANKSYCFSDGVGKISERLCKQVCSTMGLEEMTSALQIRYAGYKGMLVVDPLMHDQVDIVFRESMRKFSCNQSQILEIVKVSSPLPVFLNRHLITILGQLGVRPGVFLKLQEEMLKKLTDMLLEKDPAVEYLNSHCPLVDVDYEELASVGFELTSEPFFRSMLLGLHRKAVDGIKTKARLEIEHEFGRNMFGVLDETAILNYGEIFVKYSVDIYNPNLETKVLQGRVLVTKNPCLQFGDVRMLEAVDIPELHHIVDCIVFPQKGPRPHPNEMAGSDLDGDEYAVIWYEPLFFKQNEPASLFPVPVHLKCKDAITVSDIIQFLCHYIRNDQIGLIGNAHLAKADDLGLHNVVCHQIARKFSIAVDFVKNGEMVTLDYFERPTRYPDFMVKDGRMDTYRSKNTLGKLYRVCKDFEAESEPYDLENWSIKVDPDLELPGWKRYRDQAVQSLSRYNRLLEMVLMTYGVRNETEVMARAILSMHNRLQERQDKLDAEEMVVKSVQTLWKNMKREFMEEFEIKPNLPPLQSKLNVEEMAEDILLKASAWYMVTYSHPDPKYISFPWIMSRQLALIKIKKRVNSEGTPSPATELPSPSVRALEEMLLNSLVFNKVHALNEEIIRLCRTTCPHLMGDSLILAVRTLLHWSKHQKLTRDKLPSYNAGFAYNSRQELKRINVSNLVYSFLKVIENMSPDSLVMEMLIKFFRKCISLRFLDRAEVRNAIPLMLSRSKFLGKKSMYTYHRIAISGNVMALGLHPHFHLNFDEDHEMDPVRLPWEVVKEHRRDRFQALKERLIFFSGVREVNVREMPNSGVLLSATGPASALQILKEVLDKNFRWLSRN